MDNNLWWSEKHTENVKLDIAIKKQLLSKQSEYQKIEIFDSLEFGKMLVLDNYLMLTEKDQHIYHEMLVHVPMAVNPNAKNILVIGGGDGGTVRKLIEYNSIEKIHLVEIDRDVTEVCKEFFPDLTLGFSDKRTEIFYEDGVRFVREKKGCYDLIIVDSTDPFGPGEGLFTKEFYGSCFTALTDDGILVNQHESMFYDEYRLAMKRAHSRLKGLFPLALCYQAHIPTYPSGHWLFGFASKTFNPKIFDAEKWKELGIKTKYYNTDIHLGSFMLPQSVRDCLRT
ncbi:MAG: polyamine aminopropyltransferase [Ruminococcus sp.]|jgi:spermidine synthase|nr:polyamine aminopropyltransferase [Ruminococcus sp.]